MTDDWRPIPIPMLPANEERSNSRVYRELTPEGCQRAEREALEMMERATMLRRAAEIAEQAHAGQVDKGGQPYIAHPCRVSAAVEGLPEKTVALLHDVVEDCPDWTLDRLRAEGFDEAIIDAVDAMTKRPGEDYFVAILRARANTIARVVKLADLADNSDRSRLKEIGPREERRLAKYAKATLMLREFAH